MAHKKIWCNGCNTEVEEGYWVGTGLHLCIPCYEIAFDNTQKYSPKPIYTGPTYAEDEDPSMSDGDE